ncbi:S-layer homology domain-containing protein [Bacillus sp. M6-12]|uniref:S-layer homology domain-containing protein n=1 Tax=Bacillus sp. M6-12 TaxID=2054166 RepID=UPI0015E11F10|nr:S-layer homology domain-containing protein [Bacillus sp. M6-12]
MNVIRNKALVRVLVLLILFSTLASHASANQFKDVKADHWAYPSIEWAAKKGLVSGYKNGTFGPQKVLTEAEFIAMLIRYDCSTNKGSLTARPGEHWSSGNYRYFQKKNIPLRGYSNSTLRDNAITRGQVARIVAALDGKDLTEPYAVQYMYTKNLSSGMTGKKDFKDYGAGKYLTRAEAAVFLNRLSKRVACSFSGLNGPADGSDNSLYTPLPPNFMGDGTVYFPEPQSPPVVKQPQPTKDSRLADLDIEKGTLIANGKDKSFVTLMLKDCYGNPISNDESLSFQVSSTAGAVIEGDWGNDYYKDDFIGSQIRASSYSTAAYTDGPELTVEITAPQSSTVQQDTLSFQVNPYSANVNMSCYRNPVTVPVNYVPKAELRIETSEKISADGVTTTQVYATIVRPGGQTITDYNGRVRFHSAYGAYFYNLEASFYNGVATTTLRSVQSSQPITDQISAEFVQADPRYNDIVAPLLTQVHSTDILYDSGLNASCPIGDTEVAFIIDSSGSMRRNDPERLRVSKSQELITELNANTNIASHFNGNGMWLSGPGSAAIVSSSLYNVFQSGGTNIGEGLEEAFSRFSSTSNSKVAILITDGRSSESKIVNMIREAQNKNIRIFTIGLGEKKQLNEALLQRMATETGGAYFHAQKNTDIGGVYQMILNEIACGVPSPGCSQSSLVFSSPAIEKTSEEFFMRTFINDNCGDIARVVVRFNAPDGDVDYDLIPRGQNFYAIEKGNYEISNLTLQAGGTFLAYNDQGTLVGQIRVPLLTQ